MPTSSRRCSRSSPRSRTPSAAARGAVAVVGAGPYGLSAAVHLAGAGVDVRLLGRPMEFWREHMPDGMLLRSTRRASDIAAPAEAGTLGRYASETNGALSAPVTRD